MEDSCISILYLIINNEKHIFFSILFAVTSPLIVRDGIDCSTQWPCSNMWYKPPFTPIARWGLVSRGYENQYQLIGCEKEGKKEKIANAMKKYVRKLKRINTSICPAGTPTQSKNESKASFTVFVQICRILRHSDYCTQGSCRGAKRGCL